MKKTDMDEGDVSIIQRKIERWQRLLALNIEIARTKPHALRLDSLLLNVKSLISYLSVVDPQSPEIGRLLRLLTQTSIAIFAEATATEGEVEVHLEDDLTISLPAKGPTEYSGVNNWFDGFYAALIIRDTLALNTLSDVPLKILRRSSRSDECLFLIIGALQGIWKREKDAIQWFLYAMRATDPEKLSVTPAYILKIQVPQLDLFYRFLIGDKPKFQETLLYGLEQHKEFWSHRSDRLAPERYIAWGLLAIAGLAYDSNFPIEVESVYLPPRLMHGEYRVSGLFKFPRET